MGDHSLVHGRHRAPPPPSRPRARAAVVGGALLAAGVAELVDASAGGATAEAAVPVSRAVLGPIAQCESGGNPRASNGTHFGLFQFDLPTWRSVGGVGHPLNASVAEQKLRAGKLLDARGTQPWVSSQPCWRGLAHGPVVVRAPLPRAAPRAAPRPKPVAAKQAPAHPKPRVVVPARTAPRRATTPGHLTIRVRAGDTLSQLAAARHISMGRIHGFRSHNPNLIFPGERLTVN
jgi:hypothetical protein